jgi:DNA-binding HxlR family transcriptional regulator
MKRRELDSCPITGALQMLGDKWTMLIVRELLAGPKRTMELLNNLFPISSRTLVQRLRDMENDRLIERTDFGGNPPHIEYALTERGMLLIPLLDSLRQLGLALKCNECEDRLKRVGAYCEPCPLNTDISTNRRQKDESIILL